MSSPCAVAAGLPPHAAVPRAADGCHATGQVCTGNADLPAETTLATLAAWQAVLTDTWFTHVNHPNTLRLPDSTGTAVDTRRYLRVWRDLAKRRAERFPVACLTPLGLTLEGFLRRPTRS